MYYKNRQAVVNGLERSGQIALIISMQRSKLTLNTMGEMDKRRAIRKTQFRKYNLKDKDSERNNHHPQQQDLFDTSCLVHSKELWPSRKKLTQANTTFRVWYNAFIEVRVLLAFILIKSYSKFSKSSGNIFKSQSLQKDYLY